MHEIFLTMNKKAKVNRMVKGDYSIKSNRGGLVAVYLNPQVLLLRVSL